MEPLDPVKNEDSSGFSTRRISSILKAPQRSNRFSDHEQQENVVECAKPVEKRNSRRVSFAPANDVLLFSKDVKNATTARDPLQELLTTTAAVTQNRGQVTVTEDGNQQILGMETLLNAPLHASQQRDRVNFDTGGDSGEKTVMFATDDAFMDMTQSHTINIASDELLADISLQNCDALPTREKTVTFSTNDGSMDMTLRQSLNMTSGSVSLLTNRNMDLSVETRNISLTVPSLDPGFETFLASLSKPSAPSVKPVITRMTPAAAGASSEEPNNSLAQIKKQRAAVDKENQAPASVSALMEKSLNTSRKIGELSYGRALCPEDDLSMNMTAAQTGRFLGSTDDNDDDDHFQCLFPTQEMYSHHDNKVSQALEKTKQQSSKTFNPKDMAALKNPSLHASHQGHKVNLDTKDECREKTIMFTAGDEFMDMTQCHTVNIASSSLAAPKQKMDNASSLGERKRETYGAPSTNGLDLGFKNFLSSLSKQGAPSGNPAIVRMVPPTAASSKEAVNTNDSQPQFKSNISQQNQLLNTTRSFGDSFNGGTVCDENDVSMDMTEAQTGRIIGLTGSDDPFQCLFTTQDMKPHCGSVKKQEMTSGGKSSGALGSSNCAGTETSLKPSLKTKVQTNPVNFATEDDCRERTVRFSADDACMDVTQSHTVNIAANFKLQSLQYSDFLPTCGEKTMRFDANDASMDMTQCLTVNITDSVLPLKKQHGETYSLPGNRSSSVRSLDPSFNTSISKPSVPTVNPVIERLMPTAAQSCSTECLVSGETICPDDDVSMDMTEAQTGRILGVTATDDPPQCLFPTQDMYSQSGSLKKSEMTSQQQHNEALRSSNRKGMDTSLTASLKEKVQRHQVKFDAEFDCREKTVRFTANDACMDVTRSHTVNIATDLQSQSYQNVDFLPGCGEKTMRFTATDASMDVTRSHTVNIATDLQSQSYQNVDILPGCGEKTMRFTATDASMDVTRSHTVNIATDLQSQSYQNVDILPGCGEKTMRFTATDASMDVTRSHTVNIATDLQSQSYQNVDFLPACGEKTVKFTATDASMDVTRSHTVNIATDFKRRSHKNVDILPGCGEKTMRFTATDASMDVTRSHTVNIATDFKQLSHHDMENVPAIDVTQCLGVNIASTSVSDSLLPQRDSNILSTHENMDFPLSAKKTRRPHRDRSSLAHALDPRFKNSLSRTSAPPVITRAVAPTAPSHQESVDINVFLDQLKTQKPDVDTEKNAPGFVSAFTEKPVNKTMTEDPEDNVSMDETEPQTGRILGQTYTNEPTQSISSTQDLYPDPDHLKKTKVVSQQRNETSNYDSEEITNLPGSPDSNETDTRKGPEPTNQTRTFLQKMQSSPSAVDHDVETSPSRKSRRMSLADLKSKVRRFSHLMNTAPDTVAMDSCTASLPWLECDMDKNSKDKTKTLLLTEPELETGLVNSKEDTQAQCLMQEQPSTTTTPFHLKTKQLMSRLSMGSFKAKLPQRSKPDGPKMVNSGGEHTRTVTVNFSNQLSSFDNIYDEELDSYEDMSETLDIRSPEKATEKLSAFCEDNMEQLLEEDVFEQDFISAVNGKKRPLTVDENNMEDEKRMKTSTEAATDIELGSQSHLVERDGNITTAPGMTTQTTDFSNSSHTASIRCEATFESTFKQSLFESQLEDYGNDQQMKLNDGTITVLEFFQLFNIDFVIHNPRQSVLPGRLLSDTDRTPMDLLKDKHINRPKQMVYEADVLNLTEKVEGLKVRMRDLYKPLKIVNRPLWEEVRNSSEKELKSFGAKLKERNNLFRKSSKVQSHKMKEVLYSNLVQVNLEEQQSLRGTIEEADEMIKSLDDCIRELETELAAVEEKGFEDKPSLKSLQEETQKVTGALADNEREICKLEMQKKKSANDLTKLKVETRNLDSHVTVLHTLNEWKLGETRDSCTLYTFLYETLHLQLVYEKSRGIVEDQPERKISHITFKLQLDDEKAQGHACLVHKLLSQYIEGETGWVEKYPTSRHVPTLLHDVGLVVSRCRLLGEELRLLKMWGGLKFDILNIDCVDSQVHIVFSSLKALSKFEVIFSVSLVNHLCVLQVHSFRNMIGNKTIQQIEEIVASLSPAKNLLTKTVKNIHANLLC